jgi:hypothetical protein
VGLPDVLGVDVEGEELSSTWRLASELATCMSSLRPVALSLADCSESRAAWTLLKSPAFIPAERSVPFKVSSVVWLHCWY